MRRQADWFRQAERKLASARWDIQGEFYEDPYYIPTRYPNGFPAGAPMDFYDLPTALEAVELAESVLEYVRAQF